MKSILQAAVVAALDAAFQQTRTPALFGSFAQVIVTFVHAVQPHDEPDMRPRPIPSAVRRELLKAWEGQIELAEVP
jgi:hypothetical protein